MIDRLMWEAYRQLVELFTVGGVFLVVGLFLLAVILLMMFLTVLRLLGLVKGTRTY